MYWLKVEPCIIANKWRVIVTGRNGKPILQSISMERRMDAVRLAHKIRNGGIDGKRKLPIRLSR